MASDKRLRFIEENIWLNNDSCKKIINEIDTSCLSDKDKLHYLTMMDLIQSKILHPNNNANKIIDTDSLTKVLHQKKYYFLEGIGYMSKGLQKLREGKDIETSIDDLKKTELIFKKNKVPDIWIAVNLNTLGFAYTSINLFYQGYLAYCDALTYFKNAQDTLYISGVYRDIAFYEHLTRSDTATYLGHIDTAFQLVQKRKKNLKYYNTVYTYEYLQPKPDTAKIISYCHTLCNNFHFYRAAYDLAKYHIDKNNYDSANYYLKVFAKDTIYTLWSKENYLKLESEYFYNQKMFSKADSIYRIYSDIMNNNTNLQEKEKIYFKAQMYDNLLKEQIENKREIKNLITIVILLASTIILLVSIIIFRKKWQKKLKNKSHELEASKIQLFQTKQEKDENTNQKLYEIINSDLKIINQTKRTSPKQLKKTIEHAAINSKWDVILQEFNLANNGYISQIESKTNELKEIDKKIIVLTKLNFQASDIATLLDRELSTIYNRRSQIKKFL